MCISYGLSTLWACAELSAWSVLAALSAVSTLSAVSALSVFVLFELWALSALSALTALSAWSGLLELWHNRPCTLGIAGTVGFVGSIRLGGPARGCGTVAIVGICVWGL